MNSYHMTDAHIARAAYHAVCELRHKEPEWSLLDPRRKVVAKKGIAWVQDIMAEGDTPQPVDSFAEWQKLMRQQKLDDSRLGDSWDSLPKAQQVLFIFWLRIAVSFVKATI